MTKEEAAEAVAALVTERDRIQANLVELDTSFGKRMLSGAPALEGQTRTRWAAAEVTLAEIWEIFDAYSAVADRAAQLGENLNRQTSVKIAEIDQIFRGRPVQLTSTPAPIGRRELTAGGTRNVSLVDAVGEMKHGYDAVSGVCAAAEAVWSALAGRVQRAGAVVAEAEQTGGGVNDEVLSGALASAGATLERLRHLLAADPFSLWRQGQVDQSLAETLETQAGAAAARADELDRIRADANERITALGRTITTAQAAWADALAAQQRASARIAGLAPLRPPDLGALSRQAAGLQALQDGGRWSRLADELGSAEQAAQSAARSGREAERAALAQIARRDELRGLLDAYQAKAASLGAAEDLHLAERHRAARDLLWSAPCDLAAAAGAVTAYQQAVLALTKGGRGAGRPAP